MIEKKNNKNLKIEGNIMKITLSLEKTSSSDISIIVDAFRASTSITIAIDKFDQVIPTFTPEEAMKIAKNTKGVLAGERGGVKIDGFDLGNSPQDIKNFNTDSNTLVLTTSNGTRILENMNSTILIGCFINAKAVAEASLKIATKNNFSHIDIVMAGWKGNFAIEDFLASGEILYWICKKIVESNSDESDFEISKYAQSAILASRDEKEVKKVIYDTRSSKRLKELGYKKDIDFSLQKNISDNVAIYEKGVLKLIK